MPANAESFGNVSCGCSSAVQCVVRAQCMLQFITLNQPDDVHITHNDFQETAFAKNSVERPCDG